MAYGVTEDPDKLYLESQEKIEELQEEIKYLKSELIKAVTYLEQGKKKFTPHTTNSLVDEFISKHSLRRRRGRL